MKEGINRIKEYCSLEIADIPKRFMKLTEELGEWSAAYLEQDGFKIQKVPKTPEELNDHVLEEGIDTLIMVYDILFKQGFTEEEIEEKLHSKLDAWENILITKGRIAVNENVGEDGEINLGHLIQNAVKCDVCGEIITSTHVHDMSVCGCDNRAMTDGGGDYVRCGAVDMSKISSLALYENTGFDTKKENLIWGTYGKDGTEPLKWVKLIDCTSDHLQAILDNVRGIGPLHTKVIKVILEEREK
jgi:hypothetical protein